MVLPFDFLPLKQMATRKQDNSAQVSLFPDGSAYSIACQVLRVGSTETDMSGNAQNYPGFML